MRKIEDVTLKNGRSLKKVLKLHKKWLENPENGERANLSGENLSYVDLSNSNLKCVILESANLKGANLESTNLTSANLENTNLEDVNLTDANLTYAYLSYTNLRGADLEGAYLRSAKLRGAILSYACLINTCLIYEDLTGANLKSANLRGADLSYANLSCANLRGVDLTDADLTDTILTRADLIDANLTDIKYDHTTSFFALQCQEEGSFIGYKKANDKIVKLLITEDAKRSSATTRKCRCNKAKVLSITSLDGKKNFEKVNSNYDPDFVYEVGKIVEVKDFDEDRWKECAPGIHFFITRDEAVMY